MFMKRLVLTFTVIAAIILTATQAFAQEPQKKAQRQQWMNNMIQSKTEYVVKEIGLNENVRTKFEKQYMAMCHEMAKLGRDTRNLERSISKKENPSDLEYEKCAEAMSEFKIKEGNIEMKYFNQFKTYLTKKQLFKLKIAEQKWMNALMKHRGKGKK